MEPEPDLLRRLRSRDGIDGDVLGVLGGNHDLPALGQLTGNRVELVTMVNALHFMDPAAVFRNTRDLLHPGGGIAVISHRLPLWLADNTWTRAINNLLQDRLGTATGGLCGLDDEARTDRARLLAASGFVDITVLRHDYTADLTPRYILGHLYSALSAEQVPAERRDEFDAGVLDAMDASRGNDPLIEHVPVVALVARSPTSITVSTWSVRGDDLVAASGCAGM